MATFSDVSLLNETAGRHCVHLTVYLYLVAIPREREGSYECAGSRLRFRGRGFGADMPTSRC